MKITFQYRLQVTFSAFTLILYIRILIIMEKVKKFVENKHDLILRIEDLNKNQLAASHIVATRARFVCWRKHNTAIRTNA